MTTQLVAHHCGLEPNRLFKFCARDSAVALVNIAYCANRGRRTAMAACRSGINYANISMAYVAHLATKALHNAACYVWHTDRLAAVYFLSKRQVDHSPTISKFYVRFTVHKALFLDALSTNRIKKQLQCFVNLTLWTVTTCFQKVTTCRNEVVTFTIGLKSLTFPYNTIHFIVWLPKLPLYLYKPSIREIEFKSRIKLNSNSYTQTSSLVVTGNRHFFLKVLSMILLFSRVTTPKQRLVTAAMTWHLTW